MKPVRGLMLIITVVFSLILLNTGLSLAQETTAQPESKNGNSESEPQWLWGEVTSVDSQKGVISVKYLDYETDNEKEVNINVDDKTTYENVNAISEVKPQDTVSIDYITGSDGANIAKNISVEKPEQEPKIAPQAEE